MQRFKDLDEIGFIGNQRKQYTEEDAKSVSAFLQFMKKKRAERNISQIEAQLLADEFYKARYMPNKKVRSSNKKEFVMAV